LGGERRIGDTGQDDEDAELNAASVHSDFNLAKQTVLACPFYKKDQIQHLGCRKFSCKETHRVK
jgi:hypothetical protein